MLLDPLRFPSEEEGELYNDVELERDRVASTGGLTTEERMSTARFGRSLSEPTAWMRKGRLLEKESSGRGVGTGREERSPRVGGNVIEDGSSVESMYIVIALGGGAIKSLRSWEDRVRLAFRMSSEGLLRCVLAMRSATVDIELEAGRL